MHAYSQFFSFAFSLHVFYCGKRYGILEKRDVILDKRNKSLEKRDATRKRRGKMRKKMQRTFERYLICTHVNMYNESNR